MPRCAVAMPSPNTWAAKHPPTCRTRHSPQLRNLPPISFSTGTESVVGQHVSLESVAWALPFRSDPPARIAVGACIEAVHATPSVSYFSHSMKLSGQKRSSSFFGGRHACLAAKHADSNGKEAGDKDADYVPVMDTADQNYIPGERSSGGDNMEIIEKHHPFFMERMFPPNHDDLLPDHPQKRSGLVLSCKPQCELDYIM